ncbi:hypothetical protein [Streptomyces sp. NPDC093089]|uniref:hypothetical protein n=1 Tax=Streptomyces sp. NPDC093089 TaxID=3366024 RepID=UPI003823BD9E
MVDPGRAARDGRGDSGSVGAMLPRRTTLALLAVLLTSGCVAVPRPAAPAPPARHADLAPDAERAPAPLPARPVPTPAAAREALADTDAATGSGSGPGARETTRPARPAAPAADRAPGGTAVRPPARRVAPNHPHTAPNRAGKPASGTSGKRTATPRPPKRNRTVPSGRQQRTPGLPPEMRRLCREAEGIRAPMGAADLCRGMYGR